MCVWIIIIVINRYTRTRVWERTRTITKNEYFCHNDRRTNESFGDFCFLVDSLYIKYIIWPWENEIDRAGVAWLVRLVRSQMKEFINEMTFPFRLIFSHSSVSLIIIMAPIMVFVSLQFKCMNGMIEISDQLKFRSLVSVTMKVCLVFPFRFSCFFLYVIKKVDVDVVSQVALVDKNIFRQWEIWD